LPDRAAVTLWTERERWNTPDGQTHVDAKYQKIDALELTLAPKALIFGVYMSLLLSVLLIQFRTPSVPQGGELL
jgi:hypothetical protein